VNRRAFLGTLAGGALAAQLAAVELFLATAPAAAAPPRGKVVRLGVLTGIGWKFDPASDPIHRALLAGLTAHGYELGRNLVIEYRSADGNPERLPTLAAELVQLKVDVIVTANTLALLAAREATKTVPIVMFNVADPVETRIVESLRHPGGNITGLSYNASETSAKRVQLLREAVPGLTRVAVLWNTRLPAMALGFQQIEVAAPTLRVTVQSVRVSGSDDFDQAFAAMGRNRPGGLIVLYGPMRGNDLPRIVEFVTRHKLPTVFELERGARGGGLLEFGPSIPEMARQVGTYVDKIVNGARPADLPVEEPTRFVLVVNLKAARTMGLTIPQSLLLRADEVIQ
jgi:putative ABC transport system substrate-binding protein